MVSGGYDLAVRAVPAVSPWAVRAVLATCSLKVLNRRVLREVVERGRGYVGVVWHKDLLVALDFFRGRGITVMVSRSRDGELVARTLHRLGYRTVRGSSSRGGAAALRELVGILQGGAGSAVIADGPRGPAARAKLGCVIAARESGRPMIPVGCHVEPCLRLRNWDRTIVPFPFSRVALAFGDPIGVPGGASHEECERIRERVDAAMAEAEATCRRALGVA